MIARAHSCLLVLAGAGAALSRVSCSCSDRGPGSADGGIDAFVLRVDATSGDATARDAPVDSAAVDAYAVDCRADDVFPAFDRRCASDTECILVLHKYDCAGALRGMGIAETEREAFERAERICYEMRPDCGAPAGPSVAEDGCSCPDSEYSTVCFRAACFDGACRAYVPGGC
jgi:hypothetical protein